MGYVTGSDTIVRFALAVGAAIAVLAFVMLAFILIMRIVFALRDRRREMFIAKWRPVFALSLIQPLGPVDRVSDSEMPYLMNLFNNFHGIVHGEERENLNRLARAVGMYEAAIRILVVGTFSQKILAITAFGYLEEEESFERLARYAEDESTLLSLASAMAMVHINPQEAVRRLIPLIVSRNDWAAANVYPILHEAGTAAVSKNLPNAVMQATENDALRLIPFLALADVQAVEEAVRWWLGKTKKDEMVSSCLKMLSSPANAPVARYYLEHPAWHVRAQAAILLGKIGGREDVGTLTARLSDKEWWVRFRAAQALAELPFLDINGLKDIMASQTDRFARNIMEQVIAEKGA